VVLLAGVGLGPAFGTTPPDRLNYQGVLRNASDDPQNGSFDMVFRFLDADVGGSEILVDSHTAADGAAVTVAGGLFNVQLGGGALSDGSGAGSYTSLDRVFRDFGTVYLQITVGAETLNPRIRIISAAYALNADHLDGLDSLHFARTGTPNFFKTGEQTIETAGAATKGIVVRGVGTQSANLQEWQNSAGVALAAVSPTGKLTAPFFTGDGSFLTGLNASNLAVGVLPDGRLSGAYTGALSFSSAANSFTGSGAGLTGLNAGNLASGTVADARLSSNVPLKSAANSWTAANTFSNAANSFTGSGAGLTGLNAANLSSGTLPDGRLSGTYTGALTFSSAANSFTGSGAGLTGVNADQLDGNDSSSFIDTSATAQTKSGDLTVGDLTASGNDISFGVAGAQVAAASTSLTVTAGDASTDDLVLRVNGVSVNDGSISIFGDNLIRFRSGNGLFSFVDGPTNLETASLDASGNVQLDGDVTVSGNDINFGSPGASISAAAAVLTVTGGDLDTDDLFLTAGNSLDDGQLAIFGDGLFQLRSGNGLFSFVDGPTNLETASLDASGNLYIDGDLSVDGLSIKLTDGATVSASGSPANLTINGPNLELRLGDDDLDDVFVPGGELFLNETEGDATIYFFDDGSATTNYIGWDAARADAACSGTTATDEAIRFNAAPTAGVDQAFLFTQGTDVEFKIDNVGDAAMDGTLTQSGACDLAEAFLGPDGLEPGTVVVLAPGKQEAVQVADRPYDPTVVGVVSTRPGLLMGGPTADAYPLWTEMQSVREQLAALPRPPEPTLDEAREESGGDVRQANAAASALVPQDEATAARRRELGSRLAELEGQLDSWTRGNVPVALVGRVPVKADASFGPIRQGGYLTSSSTPGHAMVLDRPGPYFGIAMEDLAEGQGSILVLLRQGWYGGEAPSADSGSAATEPSASSRLPVEVAGVQQVPGHLQVVLDKDADDGARFSIFRDGEAGGGLGGEVFRVDEAGNVFAKGSFRPASMDLAEFFPLSEPAEPGDVLAMDLEQPGLFRKARTAADRTVVGVVSTEPGLLLGAGVERIAGADAELASALAEARRLGDVTVEARLWKQLEAAFVRTHAAVALSGTTLCKVDAGYGAVRPGDLLTASPTSGHAMRADDAPPGTVIGKALEALEAGTGTIRILVAPPAR
jgi:hypothetical protein